MILIIGGSHQGKTSFAQKNFSDAVLIDELHILIKERLDQGISETDIMSEILEKTRGSNCVVIADELGNGVVPIDRADRQWRECTGRILIELAAGATEVYRVVCGIGQRIK